MNSGRYQICRDSGAEWLGAVPSHWGLHRLGYYFDERREKVNDTEFPPLSVTKGGVVPQLETAAKTDDRDNRKKVLAGDFVINSRSDRNGSAGLSDLDGSVSLINTVLIPRSSINGRFAHYLLTSTPFQQEFYRFGSGIVADLWTTRYSEMRNIVVAVPPKNEQDAIVAFLDRETAKIDALAKEQRQLIELLTEKRSALVSYKVTKGLTRSSLMKNSGIEWMGEVPEHWLVCRVKQVARMESGHTPDRKVSTFWENCTIPWVSLHDTAYLKNHDYISETAQYVNELGIANSSARILPAQAVVFSRDATIGRCAITTRPMAVSQHFIAWLCSDRVLPEYLLFCLRAMEHELERLTFGATLKTIGMPDVGKLSIALPPFEEQEAIVRHIKAETESLEAMLNAAEHAIALLCERRAALISAAVTGKIDVRNRASASAELQLA